MYKILNVYKMLDNFIYNILNISFISILHAILDQNLEQDLQKLN